MIKWEYGTGIKKRIGRKKVLQFSFCALVCFLKPSTLLAITLKNVNLKKKKKTHTHGCVSGQVVWEVEPKWSYKYKNFFVRNAYEEWKGELSWISRESHLAAMQVWSLCQASDHCSSVCQPNRGFRCKDCPYRSPKFRRNGYTLSMLCSVTGKEQPRKNVAWLSAAPNPKSSLAGVYQLMIFIKAGFLQETGAVERNTLQLLEVSSRSFQLCIP